MTHKATIAKYYTTLNKSLLLLHTNVIFNQCRTYTSSNVASTTLTDTFHAINSTRNKNPSSLSLPEKQSLLKQIFLSSHIKHPTSRDKELLARLFGLSISVLNEMLRSFRGEMYDVGGMREGYKGHSVEHSGQVKRAGPHERHKRLTTVPNELKEQIRIILETYPNNHSLPRTEWKKIRDLAHSHSLSTHQLYRIMYRVRYPKKQITEDKKKRVHDWARDNPSQKAPSNEEMTKMTEEIGLSVDQIRYVVAQFRDPNQELTPGKKQAALEWLKKHDYREASSDTIRLAIQEIGISRQQLRDLAVYIRVKRHPPTEQQIEAVRVVFETKNRLTAQDVEDLHQSTQLHKKQIYSLLKRFASQPSIITDQHKEVLSEWLRKNQNKLPTSQEYSELQQTTGMDRRQMIDLIRYLRNPPGDITPEKRKTIEDFITSREVSLESSLSAENVEHLSRETQLSVYQVRSISRNIVKRLLKGR